MTYNVFSGTLNPTHFTSLVPKTLVSSVFYRLSVTFSNLVLVLYQFWLKLTRRGSFTALKVS